MNHYRNKKNNATETNLEMKITIIKMNNNGQTKKRSGSGMCSNIQRRKCNAT